MSQFQAIETLTRFKGIATKYPARFIAENIIPILTSLVHYKNPLISTYQIKNFSKFHYKTTKLNNL